MIPDQTERVGKGRVRSFIRSRRRVIGFLFVGGGSYVIDVGLLLLVVHLGGPAWLGATAGYWTNLIFNFFGNRFVFGARNDGLVRHGARYACLLAVNYTVTTAVMQLAENAELNLLVVKTLLVVVISVWNYFLYKNWLFR